MIYILAVMRWETGSVDELQHDVDTLTANLWIR
jgi:hypothetical protein